MAKRNYKGIELAWNEVHFFVIIPNRLIELFAKSSNLPKEGVWAFYQVAMLVFSQLKNQFLGLKLIDISREFVFAENYRHQVIKLPFAFIDEDWELKVFAKEENLSQIVMHYYAAKLNLPQVLAKSYQVEINCPDQKCVLQIFGETSKISGFETVVKVVIDCEDFDVVAYLPKEVLTYLYGVYYPKFIPMSFDAYHLELVINRLNIVLNTAVASKMRIKQYSLYKLSPGHYKTLMFDYNGFSATIYCPKTAQKLEMALAKMQVKVLESDGATVVDLDGILNFPVIKCSFDVTLEQLNSLQMNDVLLGMHVASDDLIIKCGTGKILSQLEGNSLTIKAMM